MRHLGKDLQELRQKTTPSIWDIHEYLFSIMEGIDVTGTFSFVLGGDPYLVETEADLAELKDMHNSLLEGPVAFDICETIPGSNQIVACCYINNNAGGNTYFIPYHIWHDNANINESLIGEDK